MGEKVKNETAFGVGAQVGRTHFIAEDGNWIFIQDDIELLNAWRSGH
jgi:hypothetical protein